MFVNNAAMITMLLGRTQKSHYRHTPDTTNRKSMYRWWESMLDGRVKVRVFHP